MIEDCVERCRKGQTRAYAEIVQVLRPSLLEFLYRMTHDRELAEDLGQETFLRAYRALDRYDAKKAQFSTWIFSIARNLYIDTSRKNQLLTNPLESCLESARSSEPNPDERIQNQELGQAIEDAVMALPLEHREVFILREYQDRSLEEIAAITLLPLGTVKSRLYRARQSLQKTLAPWLHT